MNPRAMIGCRAGIFHVGMLALMLMPCACQGQSKPAPATRPTETKQESPRARAFRRQIPTEKDLGKRSLAEVKTIVDLGPRLPGSIARQNAADHIVRQLKAMGLKPKKEAFVTDREAIRFENIRCPIPGRSTKVLILGTHYDTKRSIAETAKTREQVFHGANDGGSGTGLLLALAKDISALRPDQRPSLELVFFDGEESLDVDWNDAKRALHGSRQYANKHLRKGHGYAAMILLDMVGSNKLAIDLDEASTAALVPPIRAAAHSLGYRKYFFQKKTLVEDDHTPLMKKGLPCLDLIQFEDNPQWHTFDDEFSHLSARSLAIVGRTVWWALPDIEARFLGPTKNLKPAKNK